MPQMSRLPSHSENPGEGQMAPRRLFNTCLLRPEDIKPSRGDWEVVGVSERKVKLRCPVTQREVEWAGFCCFVEEQEGEWPDDSGAVGPLECHWMLIVPPVIIALISLLVGLLANSTLSPLAWVRFIVGAGYGL